MILKTKILIALLPTLLILGCSNEARHVPPLWQWPFSAIGNSVENSLYYKKRSKVKAYIISHYDDLKTEVKKGDGVHLDEVLSRIHIKQSDMEVTKQRLQKDYLTMFENTEIITEDVMNAYSSIYVASSRQETKTINGFSYTEASNIISQYLKGDFDGFKYAIEEKDKTYFMPLLKSLKIKQADHKTIFLERLFSQYDYYFIEPVVVSIMVMH